MRHNCHLSCDVFITITRTILYNTEHIFCVLLFYHLFIIKNVNLDLSGGRGGGGEFHTTFFLSVPVWQVTIFSRTFLLYIFHRILKLLKEKLSKGPCLYIQTKEHHWMVLLNPAINRTQNRSCANLPAQTHPSTSCLLCSRVLMWVLMSSHSP